MLKWKMNNKSEGYLLSIHEYREHDGFLRFLSKDYGLINLILPGYYKAKSKQSRLGIEFSKVEYQLNYRENSLNRVYGGQLLDGNFDRRVDFDWLINMSLVSELVLKLYDKRDHNFYYESFNTISKSNDPYKDLTLFLMTITEIEGFTPYLGGCIICDSKQINSFSIREGGFLCNNHSRTKDNKDVLMVLYTLHIKKEIEVNEDIYLNVIKILINYLSYHAEIRINSWKLKG